MLKKLIKLARKTTRVQLIALFVASLSAFAACESSETSVLYRPTETVLRIKSLTVSPELVALGGTANIVLEVEHELPLTSHLIDLTEIGGAAEVQLRDDGVLGDATALDDFYSVDVVVDASTISGRRNLPFTIMDQEGNISSGIVALYVDAELPNIQDFETSSSSLTRGQDTLLTVSVSSEADNVSVSADLSSLGLSSNALFNDLGVDGDLVANNGTWSLRVSPAAGIAPGEKMITIEATANGKTETFTVSVTVMNEGPTINAGASSILNTQGHAEAGPLDPITISIAASDLDGEITSASVNFSSLGGSSDFALSYNTLSDRWEASTQLPNTSVSGLIQIPVIATDNNGATASNSVALTIRNWVGLAGSDSGHGVTTSVGWALGSHCVTDAVGNIYVAYSQRVDVPASIKSSGWIYAVYVKKYDVANDIWVGLDGSDAGLGLNVNTEGETISSGYVRGIYYHNETQLGMDSKECIYVVFDGDPDGDAGDNLWDTFVMRWNITDSEWEALGTGIDASDYINPTPVDGIDDNGGVTKNGERAQEASLAFDPMTDDVYVAYHARLLADYAVYLRRFDRDTGAWEEIAGTTLDEGISDSNTNECKFPEIVIHGDYLYAVFTQEDETDSSNKDDIVIRRLNIRTDTWDAISTIYDHSSNDIAAGAPEIVVDSQGVLWVGYKVTFSSPTDQQFNIVTADSTQWNTPTSWVGAGGGSSVVTLPMSTNSSTIQPRLVVDSQDRVLSTFQQEHPGMSGSSRNVMVVRWSGSAWEGIYGSYANDGITIDPNEIDWLPAICVDPQDRPVVSWDSYQGPAGSSSNDRRKVFVKTTR